MGNRTPDLVIANDALYQLSYSPNLNLAYLNLAPYRVHPERGFAHRGGQVKPPGRRHLLTRPRFVS